MGVWQRIMDRIQKKKQEAEQEARRKQIEKCWSDLGKAGSDIAERMNAVGTEAVKAGEAMAEVLKAVTIAVENVQADPKMYGDQKEMTNNWRKMHGKPMRRRWSDIVR